MNLRKKIERAPRRPTRLLTVFGVGYKLTDPREGRHAQRRAPMRRRDRRGARLPLRKSLLGRLLTVSALVAACSVAATAWLAVQTTSGAIRQEQGQNLTADARIYNTLLGYAATHPGWEGVDGDRARSGPAVGAPDRADHPGPGAHRRLRRRREALRGRRRRCHRRPPRSSTRCPSTPCWCPTPPSRARGPRRSTRRRAVPAARGGTYAAAEGQPPTSVACLNAVGHRLGRRREPERAAPRPVRGQRDRPHPWKPKRTDVLDASDPTPTEKKALRALNQLADACLKRQGRTGVKLNLDLSWDRGFGTEARTRPAGRASHGRPQQAGGGRPAAGRGAEGGRGEGGAGASDQGASDRRRARARGSQQRARPGHRLLRRQRPPRTAHARMSPRPRCCSSTARERRHRARFRPLPGEHRSHRRRHRPRPRPHRRRLGDRRGPARTSAARAHRRRPADAGRHGLGARAGRRTTRSGGWRRPSTTWPRTVRGWRNSAR